MFRAYLSFRSHIRATVNILSFYHTKPILASISSAKRITFHFEKLTLNKAWPTMLWTWMATNVCNVSMRCIAMLRMPTTKCLAFN